MRRWIALAGLLLAAVPPAVAEVKFPTAREYIDEHRPKIEKRPLTSKEKSTAKNVIAALKKKKTLTEAELIALRPMANAGDIAAMYALFEGYGDVRDVKTLFTGGSRRESEAMAGLRGLWAMALWREGERDRWLAWAINGCLDDAGGPQTGPKSGRFTATQCGYSATIELDAGQDLFRYANGQPGFAAPRSIVFEEYAMAPKLTPEEELARFQRIIAKWNQGETTDAPEDGVWIMSWVYTQGPEVRAAYSTAYDRMRAGVNAREGAANIAKREADAAAHQARIAEWKSLQEKRIAAKAAKQELDAKDEQRFVQLSFWLRGEYIVPIGKEQVLMQQWQRDDFCQYGPADYCQRQRDLAYARENAAMEERVSRANAWKIDRSRGDVTVRSYDQNGNYLGTSTMPSWQADILKGN
ncbi:hypothetical protein [Tahibacter harae]|uniref:Lysozyme inhibitor LprI N-terminal domain-containing protein n=1 Tax=Tahibacter harae TaxID=2963937 RepID=A0ABT1QQR6_9GAMM|nr:hypothetical protein [Tahibacter harae]MCQ4164621.1 hypothetical protein [Tahibacter harae]